MATTYTITGMDCYPTYQTASDIVFIVYCNASATDGDASANWPFSQQLTVGSGPFIPFDQLTEDMVLGWVRDALGAGGRAAIDAKLAGILAAQKTPAVASLPLPWIESDEAAA